MQARIRFQKDRARAVWGSLVHVQNLGRGSGWLGWRQAPVYVHIFAMSGAEGLFLEVAV